MPKAIHLEKGVAPEEPADPDMHVDPDAPHRNKEDLKLIEYKKQHNQRLPQDLKDLAKENESTLV